MHDIIFLVQWEQQEDHKCVESTCDFDYQDKNDMLRFSNEHVLNWFNIRWYLVVDVPSAIRKKKLGILGLYGSTCSSRGGWSR